MTMCVGCVLQGDADVDTGVVVALSATNSDDLSSAPSDASLDLEAGSAADQGVCWHGSMRMLPFEI